MAYELKPAPVRRLGDVIRMLQVPQIEQEFAPENISCRQVIRQDDGTPYRDDPNAGILVLGDSFLRIYEQDEPQSAGFLAQLACALGQPVASIVNDGGASTLVRQDLHRRPQLLVGKKLVISTATVALQEQLFHRDLPDLKTAGALDFSYALAKGRAG